MLRLGEWFDFLREEKVFDNTRIIITADHGLSFGQVDSLLLDKGEDMQSVNPVFLFKDFDSQDFQVSNEFMTNADAAVLAVEDVIKKNKNPFTEKKIDSTEKNTHEQIIYMIKKGNMDKGIEMYGKYAIKDNIFDNKNWRFIE